jgi:hypothetical protein
MDSQKQWKDVVGYEGIYKISEDGELRKLKSDGTMGKESGKIGTQGYKVTKLYAYGMKKMRSIHSMVAEAFIGQCPKGKEINHIDANKQNNHYSNFEYITKAENTNHAIKMGLRWVPKGSKCKQALLSEEAVLEILNVVKSSRPRRYGGRSLAIKFGVTERTIRSIVSGQNWKHVWATKNQHGGFDIQ